MCFLCKSSSVSEPTPLPQMPQTDVIAEAEPTSTESKAASIPIRNPLERASDSLASLRALSTRLSTEQSTINEDVEGDPNNDSSCSYGLGSPFSFTLDPSGHTLVVVAENSSGAVVCNREIDPKTLPDDLLTHDQFLEFSALKSRSAWSLRDEENQDIDICATADEMDAQNYRRKNALSEEELEKLQKFSESLPPAVHS